MTRHAEELPLLGFPAPDFNSTYCVLARRLPRRLLQTCSLLQRLAVLPLVVLLVVTRADRPPPVLVLAVPVNGPLDALVEADGRLPAQRLEAGGGERVPAIMARAVLDVFDQRLVAIGQGQDPLDDLDVGKLVGTADVVDVVRPAALEDGVH